MLLLKIYVYFKNLCMKSIKYLVNVLPPHLWLKLNLHPQFNDNNINTRMSPLIKFMEGHIIQTTHLV